jgi:hypothetical protein
MFWLSILEVHSNISLKGDGEDVPGVKLDKARAASIVAMSAALYAVFFFLSSLVGVPSFVVLYLPIILLGVFPIWFGRSGLVGSMIGAFIGGFYVESLGYFAWIESVTTLIIYSLNWILIPQRAVKAEAKKYLLLLLSVYAVTLFVGTVFVLWQLTLVGFLPAGVAEVLLLPTFGLNFAIEAIICPILIRTVSPRLRSWGIYSGNFWEWRRCRAST